MGIIRFQAYRLCTSATYSVSTRAKFISLDKIIFCNFLHPAFIAVFLNVLKRRFGLKGYWEDINLLHQILFSLKGVYPAEIKSKRKIYLEISSSSPCSFPCCSPGFSSHWGGVVWSSCLELLSSSHISNRNSLHISDRNSSHISDRNSARFSHKVCFLWCHTRCDSKQNPK